MQLERDLAAARAKHDAAHTNWMTAEQLAANATEERDAARAEVERLREERDVYEPAAKNWPVLLKRCEQAEAELADAERVLSIERSLGQKCVCGGIISQRFASTKELREAFGITTHDGIDEGQRKAVEGMRDLRARAATAEADLTALRQRHAEAVKDAYIEGYLRADWPDTVQDDAEDAWVDSEAKARLT